MRRKLCQCLIAMMAVTIGPVMTQTIPEAGCDSDDLQELWRRFDDCTGQYKENYGASLTLLENSGSKEEEEKEEKERTLITCQLVDSMVEICTGIWSSCYADQQVTDMKKQFVDNLRTKNEKASISIELCGSIRNMKSLPSAEGPDQSCSERKKLKDQEEFRECSHSITTKLTHSLDQLEEKEEAGMVTACQALQDISRECVGHLASCLDQENLDITRKHLLDRQTQYFTRLLGLQLDCQDEDYHRDEASTDSLIMTEDDDEDDDDDDERNKEKPPPQEESRRNTGSKVTQETAEFQNSFSESSYVNFLLVLYTPIKILLL